LPANREIASHYFKVLRAHEEMHRLNVEIHRLYTAIHDEEHHMLKISDSLLLTDPQAAKVCIIYHSHVRINQVHLARLRAITKLLGYSGSLERGVCASMVTDPESSEPTVAIESETVGEPSDIEKEVAELDAAEEDLYDEAQD
jgi:hypothetical protein